MNNPRIIIGAVLVPFILVGPSAALDYVANSLPNITTRRVVAFGDELYFAMSQDGGLYRTDGVNVSHVSSGSPLGVFQDNLLIQRPYEMLRTDGIVTERIPGFESLFGQYGFTELDGDLYFAAQSNLVDSPDHFLYRTNGCSVELVSDLHLDRESFHSLYDSSDRAFPVFDNNLYFLADTAEHENVLFRTDGESVVEVFSDFDCSFWSDGCRAQAIGVFQNDFYFMAGEGIYRTSGQTVTQIETPRDDYVSVETRPVENVPFRFSGAGVEFQDAFYVFLERHGSLVTPSDLVKLDRSHVEIINELGYFSANSQLVEVRGKLLYTGFGETGYELYSIDGQSINAVADIHAQNEDYVVGDPFFGLRSSSFPDTFLTAHDRLYFLADDGTADGLYWTDGDTVERLTDALRTDAWAPLPLAHFHGEVFFLGPNGSLRSTDGANVFDYLGLELSGEPLTSIEVLHLIGDKLFIYGSSDISTGFVVVTAVPEPATHTCLALILLVIAGVRRSIIRQLPIRFQFTPLLTPGGQRVRSLPQFPRAQLS